MARKTYTQEELLALRGPAPQSLLEFKLIDQVEKDPSVGTD